MSEVEKIVNWIRSYFDENGKNCNAIVGISGGTDSSVVAALLVKALGKERVIGVLMPCNSQHDIDVSYALVKHLDIKYFEINIGKTYRDLTEEFIKVTNQDPVLVDAYKSNTPARLRMTTVYGISALYNGRVANTCNLSEDYVGYSTKFGDAAGDFSPISSYTKTEVRELGKELGLPSIFVDKVPEDGMSGKSDEEKLGFTYEVLDRYIRTGEIDDLEIKKRIDHLHSINLHKLLPMPSYKKEK
ncbi:MAG: NAD(+) synthase [Bacilli bacterium]|nr:NAD(+) synthase [Bacilli bacterium]